MAKKRQGRKGGSEGGRGGGGGGIGRNKEMVYTYPCTDIV